MSTRHDEFMRVFSARTTERIAKRWGNDLGIRVGAGYPKSGTVWLCKLMSSYLGIPFPQNYRLPVAMASVIHAHWDYAPREPPTVYIYRDGRDVMVSLYFHHMRNLRTNRNPASARRLRERLERGLGIGFNPDDIRNNMPAFIRSEFEDPAYRFGTWDAHINQWCIPRKPDVTYVSYESLVHDTEGTLAKAMRELTGTPADPVKIQLAVARQDFHTQSGRTPGSEDRTSFLRSGVAGDWTKYFSRAAGEEFDSRAGNTLIDLGYARPGWPASLDE